MFTLRCIRLKEKVADYFKALHDEEKYIPQKTYQNISKEKVELFLSFFNFNKIDYVSTIMALLDNVLPNAFRSVSNIYSFSDGATIAQIGSYIGYLLNCSNGSIDRENVRDYYVKPLIEIGVIEPILLPKGQKIFILGHKAKSPNNAYRLTKNFINFMHDDLLNATSIIEWQEKNVNSNNATLAKIKLSQENIVSSNKHVQLIHSLATTYAETYLENYTLVYKDDADGDRISEGEQMLLEKNNIEFGKLDDVWPDLILYNAKTESLWFGEAVTSDGEIDKMKYEGFLRICENSNKNFGGCTTAYMNWQTLAKRQSKASNLYAAKNSYFWIRESPDKQFEVSGKNIDE